MAVFCVHSVKDQSQSGTNAVVSQCRQHGPSITYKITPCWGTLLQPARRAAVLVQPSSLRPHWSPLRNYTGRAEWQTGPQRLLPHGITYFFSGKTCFASGYEGNYFFLLLQCTLNSIDVFGRRAVNKFRINLWLLSIGNLHNLPSNYCSLSLFSRCKVLQTCGNDCKIQYFTFAKICPIYLGWPLKG